MQHRPPSISVCRHCRFYQPEGRRGGACQQLNVMVQSAWPACNLGVSPFDDPPIRVDPVRFSEPFTLPALTTPGCSAPEAKVAAVC